MSPPRFSPAVLGNLAVNFAVWFGFSFLGHVVFVWRSVLDYYLLRILQSMYLMETVWGLSV